MSNGSSAAIVDAYRGDLLPDEPYAEWTLGPRAALRERRLAVMRSQGRWEEVLREDPADEEAHRALMRRRAAGGDRPGAARQFRVLREELSRLGVEPSAETLALQRELTRGPPVHATRLLHAPIEGRERELSSALGALQRAADFDGGALLITGPMGIGKTRLLEAVLAEAERAWLPHACAVPARRRRAGRRTRRSPRRWTRSPSAARS